MAVLLTQAANDVRQLVPMATAITENVGRLADVTTADAGYFSEANVTATELRTTNLLVPPDRQKHGTELQVAEPGEGATAAQRMRFKLSAPEGRALYKLRKAVVEPVFGQIKSVRGLGKLLLRGLDSARAEFNFIATTHNLLKLFRSGFWPGTAPA